MKGKKWHIPKSKYKPLKKLLISLGGIIVKNNDSQNIWMIKIENYHFALFSNGTLYSYPDTNDELEIIRNQISRFFGNSFVEPNKEFLVGLDEVGTAEIFGNIVITAVCYPFNLHYKIEKIIGVSDTKKKHNFDYWKKLYFELKKLESFGLILLQKSVKPEQIKSKSIQSILNEKYLELLKEISNKILVSNSRIVIDDFGLGKNLTDFLESLSKSGALILKRFHADDDYLETKTASVVAKYHRMNSLNILNRKYCFENIPIGSGHPEDPQSMLWMKEWKKLNKTLPSFIRKPILK